MFDECLVHATFWDTVHSLYTISCTPIQSDDSNISSYIHIDSDSPTPKIPLKF